jgi:hypothetical protein
MSNNASDRPREPAGRRLGLPRKGRRRLAGVLAAVALAAAVQLACDGDSPTAPPPPPPPAPDSFVFGSASYAMIINPVNEDREHPRGAELLVDGRSIWNGAVSPPYCCDYYGYEVSTNVIAEDRTPLAPGPHTLTFRITDQRRSPTGYLLSGWVNLSWTNSTPFRNGRSQNAVNWQDAQARLRTGQDWSIEFVVPDGPSV